MTLSTFADFFVPELFVEAIKGSFTGVKALWGTRAAILNGTMPPDPEGPGHIRKTINIPYFASIGEFDDASVDGDALPVNKISDSGQTATIQHAGKVFSITDWARMAAGGGDPYAEAARQMSEGFQRRIDKALIDSVITTYAGINTTQVIDVHSATTPRKMDLQLLNQGKATYSDEQSGDGDDVVLLVVHSATKQALENLVDSTGRPLLTSPVDGGLPRFMGIPVGVSNRLTTTAQAAAGTYVSAMFKAGSLACWYDGTPVVKTDTDITVPTEVLAVHTWFTAHTYTKMPARTKGGAVVFIHN